MQLKSVKGAYFHQVFGNNKKLALQKKRYAFPFYRSWTSSSKSRRSKLYIIPLLTTFLAISACSLFLINGFVGNYLPVNKNTPQGTSPTVREVQGHSPFSEAKTPTSKEPNFNFEKQTKKYPKFQDLQEKFVFNEKPESVEDEIGDENITIPFGYVNKEFPSMKRLSNDRGLADTIKRSNINLGTVVGLLAAFGKLKNGKSSPVEVLLEAGKAFNMFGFASEDDKKSQKTRPNSNFGSSSAVEYQYTKRENSRQMEKPNSNSVSSSNSITNEEENNVSKNGNREDLISSVLSTVLSLNKGNSQSIIPNVIAGLLQNKGGINMIDLVSNFLNSGTRSKDKYEPTQNKAPGYQQSTGGVVSLLTAAAPVILSLLKHNSGGTEKGGKHFTSRALKATEKFTETNTVTKENEKEFSYKILQGWLPVPGEDRSTNGIYDMLVSFVVGNPRNGGKFWDWLKDEPTSLLPLPNLELPERKKYVHEIVELYRLLETIQTDCKKIAKIGAFYNWKTGEIRNEQPVCLDKDTGLHEGSIVLSFQDHVKDWSLEDRLSQLGCKVRYFSPELITGNFNRTENFYLYAIGLDSRDYVRTGSDNTTRSYFTYSSVLQHLGLVETFVDYLKLDLSNGRIWTNLKSLINDSNNQLTRVKQLSFEIDLEEALAKPSLYPAYLQVLKELLTLGFQVFYSHPESPAYWDPLVGHSVGLTYRLVYLMT